MGMPSLIQENFRYFDRIFRHAGRTDATDERIGGCRRFLRRAPLRLRIPKAANPHHRRTRERHRTHPVHGFNAGTLDVQARGCRGYGCGARELIVSCMAPRAANVGELSMSSSATLQHLPQVRLQYSYRVPYRLAASGLTAG